MGAKWSKIKIRELDQVLFSQSHIKITKKALAERLGLTENGLNYALKEESLKLSVFQNLCEILEINPCAIFKCEDVSGTVGVAVRNELKEDNERLQKEVEYLRKSNDLIMKILLNLSEEEKNKEKYIAQKKQKL
jgi:DNA-binding Xre family transcriptional regulator